MAHHSGEFVHGSRRLRAPLERIGPRGSERFERIGWEHALETIHQRVTGVIGRWGREAVMPLNYAGPHGMLAYDSMSLRFFHKLGASLLFRGSMCGAVRNEAWVGTYGGVPGIGPEAAAQAKLNVVWGNNATVTNVHLVRNIHASRRRAAGWWSSIPCAPRSPSRPTCISRPGRAPTSFWVSRSPSSWSGSAPITPPSSPSM